MPRKARKRIVEEQPQRLRGRLSLGAVLSLLLHVGTLLPLGVAAFVFGAREQARRDDEVEVTFESVDPSTLPADLPPINPDEWPPPRPAQRRSKDETKRLAEQQPSLPEQTPQATAEPETQQQPPPPEARAQMKAVEVDQEETEAPADARFLAEKNTRVQEETRANETNLEREQKGNRGSSPSDRKDEEVGDDQDKVAELDDKKSKLGRAAPEVTPHRDVQMDKGAEPKSKSLLSMREAARLRHEVTPEAFDASLPRDPSGERALPVPGLQAEAERAGRGARGSTSRFALSAKNLDYLVGQDAEAAERLAQTQRSKRGGRHAQRWGRIRSALENFVPEVRPGNQTALNTRAAPFATFIARMHRTIHKLWGFGFLEDLDAKPSSSPYNDRNLVTKLEIVLAGDGTVEKVGLIRTSGFMPFDVAAIDAVYSAGPYADPPREIRSKNGKIYVHWHFHRDERQCSTAGAEYFILDNPPADGDTGGDEAASRALLPPPRPPGPKRLQREVADTPANRAKLRQLDEAAGGPEEPPPDARSASERAAPALVRANDPGARRVAQAWFDAYTRGDVGRMLSFAAFPFRSSGGVAAKDAGELRQLLDMVIEETPGARRLTGLDLFSPAGARGALGALPPGFEDAHGLLFAVGRASGGTFVLALAPTSGDWKAIGLVRR